MSSRLRQQILSLSLEDETSVEVPVVEEGADSLEAELSGVLSADQEVVEADQAVEDLGEVQASLESIQVSLESALADGGLDPHAAAMFRHAIANSAGRVGFTDNLPSLESFGGTSDRERVTRVSLEGVKELIVRVWQAIITTVKRWWGIVEKFFYKVFASAPKLIKRADKLKLDAAANKKDMNEGAKMKLSGVHAELAGGNAAASAGELKTVAEDIFGAYAGKMTQFGEKAAQVLKEQNVESDATLSKSLTSISTLSYPVPASCNVEGNPSEYGVAGLHSAHTSKPLPGGKILVTIAPKNGVKFSGDAGVRDFLKTLENSKSFMSSAKGHTAAGEGEHAPLSKQQIIEIAEAVSKAAQEVMRYQRVWTGDKKVKTALEEAGNEYSKKDFSKLEGEAASLAKDLPRLVGATAKTIDSAQRAFAGYALSTGAALVQLGEKSLGHHGDKKAEVPAAAPAAAAAA
jgi:hypothetical protein